MEAVYILAEHGEKWHPQEGLEVNESSGPF